MISLNRRIAKLPLSARIADLLSFCEKSRGFEQMQICVPDSTGFRKDYTQLDLDLISKSSCFGCLCCLEKGDADAFDINGVPTISNHESFSKISAKLFKGTYAEVSPNPRKYWTHTSLNEKGHTTPISANLLLFLSSNPNDVVIRCSPNWELSIDTTDSEDPREGHLDLIVVNCVRKKILVGEVKSSVTNLLRDRRRDQWDRYNKEIEREIHKKGYDGIFLHIIGGDEFSLYPEIDGVPYSPTNRREEFYDFMNKGSKRFISVEALRALKLQKLSTHPNISWEDYLFKLFSQKSILGLISGGSVDKKINLNACSLK